MNLSRRLLLGRGLLGAALAPLAGPGAARSVAGRLAAATALPHVDLPSDKMRNPVGPGSGGVFSELWWNRARWEAEDQILAAGYTLPVDADLAGLRSLSPMARQRLMRRRLVDRTLAQQTTWDRAAALFKEN